MLTDVTLGQFVPSNSPLHKLDPRSKILLTITLIVITFLAKSYVSLAIVLFNMVVITFLSGVPMKLYFKSVKFIIFITLFTSIMNLFYGEGEVLLNIGFAKITTEGLQNTITAIVRLISLILASSALTFTTSPNDLTTAIERIMKPLALLRIDVHSLAMMMTIALRFVPTLIEEAQKIINAQKARGANLETGSFINRTKALVPIIVPLFVSSFRRAFDLSTAMECRCYRGGNNTTRMKILKLTIKDLISVIWIALICSGVILCNGIF